MAKQTFTTGQVLTAAQMTNLQQTAMGGGTAVVKTASYVLVAADAGTVIQMNSASSTTITVNTALFAAGDSVFIQNIGAGVCTITAGTATVTTAGSLALTQWEGGQLYFTSTSASIFFDYIQAGTSIPLTTKGDLFGFDTANARIPVGTNNQVLTADSTQALGLKWATPAGGGKVLQVVQGTTTTTVTSTSTSFVDTGLTATITPTLNTSKILVILTQNEIITQGYGTSNVQLGSFYKLLRGATSIWGGATSENLYWYLGSNTAPKEIGGNFSLTYLDSPATTSATTYKTQAALDGSINTMTFQNSSTASNIILMEIGA